MPRLTVLMPIPNVEASAQRTTALTLRDLPQDAELVVVAHDAREDEIDALRNAADARLRVRVSHQNAAFALNDALDSTDSEYVAVTDTTNAPLRGRFFRQLHAVQRSDVLFSSASQPALREPSWSKPSETIPLLLLLLEPLPSGTMLARRSVISTVGGYRPAADTVYDLWLRLAATGARIRQAQILSVLRDLSRVLHHDQAGEIDWCDPLLKQAYGDLAISVLGERFTPPVPFCTCEASSAEQLERFISFERAFTLSLAEIPWRQRRLLSRSLDKRADAFWRRLVLESSPHDRMI